MWEFLVRRYPGRLAYKQWESKHRESALSKLCPCPLQSSTRGDCRKCEIWQGHFVCIMEGECRRAFNLWLRSGLLIDFKAIYTLAGMQRGLMHIGEKHLSKWNESADEFVNTLRTDRQTIISILSGITRDPLKLYSKGRQMRVSKSTYFASSPRNPLNEQCSSNKQSLPVDHVVDTIKVKWRGPAMFIKGGGANNEIVSECPKHRQARLLAASTTDTDPSSAVSQIPECSIVLERRSKRRHLILLDINKALNVKMESYKCTAGGANRWDMAHKDFVLSPPDCSGTVGYCRHNNLLCTPFWLITAVKTFHRMSRKAEVFYKQMVDHYVLHFKQQHPNCSRVSDKDFERAMKKYLPSKKTMMELVHSWRCHSNPLLAQICNIILFERTPLIISFDCSWYQLKNAKWNRILLLIVALATSTDDKGNWLMNGLANENSESHYALGPFLANIKLHLIMYGNKKTLMDNPVCWLSDHHKKNKFLRHHNRNLVTAAIEADETLKQDLERLNFDINQTVDVDGECGMHGILRMSKSLNRAGITKKNHRDLSLYNLATSRIYASIAYSETYITDPDKMNALSFFNKYKEFIVENDRNILWILTQIILCDGLRSVSLRDDRVRSLQNDPRYIELDCWFRNAFVVEIRRTAHYQLMGRWFNASDGVDDEWETKQTTFYEKDGTAVPTMTVSSIPELSNIVLRFFGSRPVDFRHPPLLEPRCPFVIWSFDCIASTFTRRLRDDREHTKPLMSLAEVRSQLNLAKDADNVKAQLRSRDEFTSGKVGNMDNERIHSEGNLRRKVVRGDRAIEHVLCDLHEDKVRQNIANVLRQAAENEQAYDPHFVQRFRNIAQEYDYPSILRVCFEQKTAVNLTGNWSKWKESVDQMLVDQDIVGKHRSVVKFRDRQLIHNELIRLKPGGIDHSLLAYLAVKFNYSVYAICLQCQSHGLTFQRDDNGDKVLNPDKLGEVYGMLKNQSINPYEVVSAANSVEVPPEHPVLPTLPSLSQEQGITTNQDAHFPVEMSRIFQLQHAFKFLNAEIDELQVNVDLLHCKADLDVSAEALLKLLQSVANSMQIFPFYSETELVMISSFLQVPEHADLFGKHMERSGMSSKSRNEITDSSVYQSMHDSQHVCAAQHLRFGVANVQRPSKGDPRRKRRMLQNRRKLRDVQEHELKDQLSEELSGRSRSSKKRKTEWISRVKFQKNSSSYAERRQCATCPSFTAEFLSSKTKNFGFHDTGTLLNHLQNMSWQVISEASYKELRSLANAHGCRQRRHKSASYLKDWLVHHIRDGVDLEDEEATELVPPSNS